MCPLCIPCPRVSKTLIVSGGIVNAHALYRKFRENKSFSGSELNIEGAAVLHTTIFGGSLVGSNFNVCD
jgi:hypothetical protein